MKLKCCPALCLFALKKKKKFDYLCIIIYYSIHANVRTGRNEEISFFFFIFSFGHEVFKREKEKCSGERDCHG